jgi:hypothetical protein
MNRPVIESMHRNPFERFDFESKLSVNEWVWVPQRFARVLAVRVLRSSVRSMRNGIDVFDRAAFDDMSEDRLGIVEHRLREPLKTLPAMEIGVTVLSEVERVVLVVEYMEVP